MTGWNLPPGCTTRHIDEMFADRPCAVCGRFPDDCLCLECDVCGCYGDPKCYLPRERGGHELPGPSAFQIASLAEAEARWQAENDAESAWLAQFCGAE